MHICTSFWSRNFTESFDWYSNVRKKNVEMRTQNYRNLEYDAWVNIRFHMPITTAKQQELEH